MLKTNVPLKCNVGKKLPTPYFQFPRDKIPGHFDSPPALEISFLKPNTIEHFIFLELLPGLAGIIAFSFFLISSGLIVYGLSRHIYADYMLPRRKKTLRKLGKLPEDKKRKRYRKRKTSTRNSFTPGDNFKPKNGMDSNKELHTSKTQKPFYLDGFSESESDNHPVREILSETTPPIKVNKNDLPTVAKLMKIPGEPFPTLPNAPLSSKDAKSPIPPKHHVDIVKIHRPAPATRALHQDDEMPETESKQLEKRRETLRDRAKQLFNNYLDGQGEGTQQKTVHSEGGSHTDILKPKLHSGHTSKKPKYIARVGSFQNPGEIQKTGFEKEESTEQTGSKKVPRMEPKSQ